MGLEQSAIVLLRDGGARVSVVVRRRGVDVPELEMGVIGRDLFVVSGAEKAEPMSESVSERTCMRMDGAILGT